MRNFSFRKATDTDSLRIATIHNINVRDQSIPKHRGFLLSPVTEQQILKKLEHDNPYFVAVNETNEVLGFLAVSVPKIDHTFLDRVFWHNDSYRSKIASDNNLYIQTVAVEPRWSGQGIAQFMYRSLYQEFPTSFFTTFIVSKPIENSRSLVFHEKQGFLKVGTIYQEQFLDLKNYESILLLRE